MSDLATFSYGGRIHRGKLTGRSLRYAAADVAARLVPALRRRWSFPVQAVPIAQAGHAVARIAVEQIAVPQPPLLLRVADRDGAARCTEQIVYSLRDVRVTGQAGAVLQGDRLVALRDNPNWAIALRPRRHTVRQGSGAPHYNLVCPVPARGQIFLWLYDYVVPLMAWLEASAAPPPVLLVNARQTQFQARTIAFLVGHYKLPPPQPLGEGEVIALPQLWQPTFAPDNIRALRPLAGLAALDRLAAWLAPETTGAMPAKLYISREDARLRRVGNEAALLAALAPLGFAAITLKGRSIEEQVELFRAARTIVAPHGAGLTNISWCRPGTRIIEAFPSPDGPLGPARNASSSYWRVACQRGLRYTAIEGEPRQDRRDRFDIPVAAVLAELAA